MSLASPYQEHYYVADGVTTSFSFGEYFTGLSQAYVKCIIYFDDGTNCVPTFTVDMTTGFITIVTLTKPDGTVLTVPPAGSIVRVFRDTPEQQNVTASQLQNYTAKQLERIFDSIVAMIQEVSYSDLHKTIRLTETQRDVSMEQLKEENDQAILYWDFETRQLKATDYGQNQVVKSDTVDRLIYLQPEGKIYFIPKGSNNPIAIGSATIHNDLGGRNAPDCHPESAITNLTTHLQELRDKDTAIEAKADAAVETANQAYSKAETAEGVANSAYEKSVEAERVVNTFDGRLIQAESDASDAKTTAESTQLVVDSHVTNKSNPHEVTKTQVGLGNVDNTSDLDKPISTATQAALNTQQEEIDALSGRGRFLSLWNCVTGLPETDPETESPYVYHTGDYYIVGTVSSATPAVNYKPSGSSYVFDPAPVPSSVVETGEVSVNDTYVYDGENWILQSNTQKEVSFSALAGSPYDNTNLSTALNSKQNTLTAGTNISIVNNVISSTAQESFFRGKWNTWSNVPTVANLYPSDYKGSHIPTETDYMVVEDASGYVPGLDIELFIPQTGTRRFTLGGEEKIVPDYPNEVSWVLPDITITASFHNGNHSWFTANKTVKCDNIIYAPGETFAKVQYYGNPGPTIYYSNSDSLSGAWRFTYRGTWATDNVSGWKPEYQVEDVLPVASPTEAGIAKLYTTTGSNTDGAIDQNGTTTAINTAVSTHNTASNAHSNIRGTANGLATLDANAKVPLAQMNDAVLGNVSYQGLWNAATNDPFLPNPSGELPIGYTQYGWIKTVSGTPYIDTGISYDYANEDEITVETKLNYLRTARAGYYSFGFTSGNGNINIWKTWQGIPTVRVGGLTASIASETDTVVSMKVDKVLRQNSITIDGTTTYGTISSFANLNIYVLAANNGGTPSSNQSYVKFYYVNISKSGTLLARLLPCKRNSDDAVGMYDTVRNTFYPVTGGVAEVGGAIEIPKGHYYITSTAGTQFGIHFEVGDWVISNGTSWTKVDNTDAVSSVEGRTGNVTVINDNASTGATTYTWSADKLETEFSSLGTAAYTASTDYATSAQGAKADTALQPADVQEYTANEVETLWNSI